MSRNKKNGQSRCRNGCTRCGWRVAFGAPLSRRRPSNVGSRPQPGQALRSTFSRRATREPIELELNGQLALVLPSNDGHRAALSFVVSDGRITRIDAIRNPEKLRRL